MEALILRRNYPTPVTFADLRRAHAILQDVGGVSEHHRPTCVAEMRRAINRADRRPAAAATARIVLVDIMPRWHAALKEATGATDDVYAVIDGREVHVARVSQRPVGLDVEWMVGNVRMSTVSDLLITADEADYWERPHEVRIDLQERIPTKRTIGKVVERSLFEAGVRRG